MRATILVVFTLFIGACAGNTPAEAHFTCQGPGASRCTDYVSGWTEDSARSLCETGFTFSTSGECPPYPTGRCTVSLDGVLIIYGYELFSDTLPADCAALGGDYAELP